MSSKEQNTQQLVDISAGNHQSADQLMSNIYDELKRLAASKLASEPAGHTLQPTALVHEVYLRMIDQSRVDWRGRTHFFAISASMMRRVLVDHARSKHRQKRGGGARPVSLDEALTISLDEPDDVLAVNEALDKLSEENPLQAKIVEMRIFGGLTVDEVAEALELSKRSVERHWTMVRAWLRRELGEDFK